MPRILWICFGGAMGTGARYLVQAWAAERFGAVFPFGTWIVNVAGSFLISAIMQIALESPSFSPTLRLALTTGVLGGFTTYSSFSYETLELFRQGSWLLGAANVIATTLGCLVACWLGFVAARSLGH